MSAALDVASWALVIAGGAFSLIGGVGMLRMPDFYTRVHAASLTDIVGSLLILLGLALQAGLSLTTAKLAVIALLLFFTSPAATHALVKAALERGLTPLGGEGASKP
jgi:multicomponent Na+:H+ antiporter subunit G